MHRLGWANSVGNDASSFLRVKIGEQQNAIEITGGQCLRQPWSLEDYRAGEEEE